MILLPRCHISQEPLRRNIISWSKYPTYRDLAYFYYISPRPSPHLSFSLIAHWNHFCHSLQCRARVFHNKIRRNHKHRLTDNVLSSFALNWAAVLYLVDGYSLFCLAWLIPNSSNHRARSSLEGEKMMRMMSGGTEEKWGEKITIWIHLGAISYLLPCKAESPPMFAAHRLKSQKCCAIVFV